MRDLEDDRLLDQASGIPSMDRPLTDLSDDELRKSDEEVLRLQKNEPYDFMQSRMVQHRHDIMEEAKRRDKMDDVYGGR